MTDDPNQAASEYHRGYRDGRRDQDSALLADILVALREQAAKAWNLRGGRPRILPIQRLEEIDPQTVQTITRYLEVRFARQDDTGGAS